jgi:hypothetical protein
VPFLSWSEIFYLLTARVEGYRFSWSLSLSLSLSLSGLLSTRDRSSQRPLPDNTQHSQETYIHATGTIRTRNPKKRAAYTHVLDCAVTGIGYRRFANNKRNFATDLPYDNNIRFANCVLAIFMSATVRCFNLQARQGWKIKYSCILFKHRHVWSSRGSSVGIATTLMAANPEIVVRSQEIGKKVVFLPTRPYQLRLPNLPFKLYKRFFPSEVTWSRPLASIYCRG